MKDIKQTILDKSRYLFNAEGVNNISLRKISLALKISQGNLNYHFKNKQDIIEALYFELTKKMDYNIKSLTSHLSPLSLMFLSAEKSMTIFYQYRFLIRDIYLIFRENEKIRLHYIQLQKFRKKQFMEMFKRMINQKILRSPEFQGEYERLYERINILGDNWINALELLKNEISNPVLYYHLLLFETIYPYLTRQGKSQFIKIKKSL